MLVAFIDNAHGATCDDAHRGAHQARNGRRAVWQKTFHAPARQNRGNNQRNGAQRVNARSNGRRRSGINGKRGGGAAKDIRFVQLIACGNVRPR